MTPQLLTSTPPQTIPKIDTISSKPSSAARKTLTSKNYPIWPLFLSLFFLILSCGDRENHSVNISQEPSIKYDSNTDGSSFTIPNYRIRTLFDNRTPIPIFIITCDRLTWLKRTLTGLDQAIDRPIEVIIHDNNSTFPDMVDFLKELESNHIKVVRHTENLVRDTQLDNIRITIEEWFANHDAPYYAVTDPDIEFTRHDGKLLDFYEDLLRLFPQIDVVGPTLRIDDLPDHYPFKSTIYRNEAQRRIDEPTFSVPFNGGKIEVCYGAIDTTFGLYRKSFKFRRVNRAVQAYAPYAARHLDWYLDPEHLTEDQNYYLRNASKVSHAGGTWLREFLDQKR